MTHLLGELDKLKPALCAKSITLFLDYDGTLVPIAPRPQDARLAGKMRHLLESLKEFPEVKLAIVSGRGIEDLKKIIGINGIIYVGNHGFQIEGPQIKFESLLSTGYRAALEKIKKQLSEKLSSIRGVLLEDKGFSLSLHYRLVNKKLIPRVKAVFRQAYAPFLAKNQIKVRPGKMLLEVKPPIQWDKGKVVLWLLARWRFGAGNQEVLPIYLGDDLTDEDVFRVLKNRGWGVFIGRPKESAAKYYLKNTAEVREFLSRLRGYLGTSHARAD